MGGGSGTDSKEDPSKNVFVSKSEFSPLLNTYITTICTHYHHDKFKSTKQNGKIEHHVISCIDVDMTKYLRIKKEGVNQLKSDAQLPQLDRSTFLVTDSENMIVRMDESWKLPFNYITPFTPHLVPITGIKNVSELENRFIKSESVAQMTANVTNDPKNPSLVTKMTIIGQERVIGKFLKTQSSQLETAKQKYFFYFDSKRKGDKTSLIQNRVQNSKWQITLLTLIFIMMVSGVVMCISYK